MNSGKLVNVFKDREEVFVLEERIETYDCELFDKEIGLYRDYESKPHICKNTKCEVCVVKRGRTD
jgi:hypothetical protein